MNYPVIAHLTDVHLDGSRERRERLASALWSALAAGACHLCLTGDLTAHGELLHFAELAAALHRSAWGPESTTIVPGNHDLGDHGWAEVLSSTALKRYAATSAPGATADRGAFLVTALSTQAPRRALAFRARGRLPPAQLAEARRVGQRAAAEGRCLVLAMHHGPQAADGKIRKALQPFDGLSNRREVLHLLRDCPTSYVLCGHDHRSLDAENGRVFCAPSVVENRDPLRLYEVRGSVLHPTRRGDKGRYLYGLVD